LKQPKASLQKFSYVNPYMTKDMAHMIMKLIILRRIKENEIYTYALIKEFDNSKMAHLLKRYDADTKNAIYNIVNALEKSGYVKVREKIEKGRLKRYFYITEDGKDALDESKKLFLKSMKELTKIIK
jgi:DNA-binding PadR family transcriptional regulator